MCVGLLSDSLEDEYITLVFDFLKDYGVKKKYTRKVLNDSIVYYVDNPGWSVDRQINITNELKIFLKECCTKHSQFKDCYTMIKILIL